MNKESISNLTFVYLLVLSLFFSNLSQAKEDAASFCKDIEKVQKRFDRIIRNKSIWHKGFQLTSSRKGEHSSIGRAFYNFSDRLDRLTNKCKKYLSLEQNKCFDNANNFRSLYQKTDNIPHRQLGLPITDDEFYQRQSSQYDLNLKLPLYFDSSRHLLEMKKTCFKDPGNKLCKEFANWDTITYQTLNCFHKDNRSRTDRISRKIDGDKIQYVIHRSTASPQMIEIKRDGDKVQMNLAVVNSFGLVKEIGFACVNCHSAGPKKIEVVPGSVNAADWEKIVAWNKSIETTPQINWSGVMNLKHRGPMLGKNVGCVKCHNDGQDPGSQASLAYYQISEIQRRVLVSHSMPDFLETKMSAFSTKSGTASLHYKIAQLPLADRNKIKEYWQGSFQCHQDHVFTISSWENTLAYLKSIGTEKGGISTEEYKELYHQLRKGHKIAQAIFKAFKEEADEQMYRWLSGGRENCLLNPIKTDKRQSTPSTIVKPPSRQAI